MKTGTGWRVAAVWALVFVAAVGGARAQTREVTVAFLKAAAGSLTMDARVSFTAIYDSERGLVEAGGRYMINKGYSRFRVVDPQQGAVFDAVYCAQRSKVFEQLLNTSGRQAFVFYGYRSRGEFKEDCVIVTDVKPVKLPEKEAAQAEAATARMFRITLVDGATSNRTVLVNVELGKPYSLLGGTVQVDAEPGGGVKVIGAP
jgi:hypothetical protein